MKTLSDKRIWILAALSSLLLATQNCAKTEFSEKATAQSKAAAAPIANELEAVDEVIEVADVPTIPEPQSQAQPQPQPITPPPQVAPPSVASEDPPAAVPPQPPIVNDPEIDPQLAEVTDLIRQVSPDVSGNAVFYVKSQFINVQSISFLGFTYEKLYSQPAASDAASCKAAYNTDLFQTGQISIPLNRKQVDLTVNQCFGFADALERKGMASGGKCVAGRENVKKDARAVGLISEQMFSIDFDLVQDSQCLCYKEFNFKLLQGMAQRYTARGFVDSAQCSSRF